MANMHTPCRLTGLPVELIARICDLMSQKKTASVPTVSRLEQRLVTEHDHILERPHPAANLSETCRWIRAACAPRIFSVQTLSDLHLNVLPPRRIWQYSRTLCIGFTPLQLPDKQYIAMLRGMIGLIQIFCCPGWEDLSNRHLRIFLSSPVVQVFRVNRFQFDRIRLIALPPLRILDLSQRARRPIDIPRANTPSEMFALEILVDLFRLSLEILYLPGESCRLSFLASKPWLSLHELVICGGPPEQDTPFHCVLSAMPLLRVLTLVVARPPGSRWLLSPRGICDVYQASLPRLQRVTLSDLAMEDAIVSLLPDDLTELSLRDMPRYHLRRYSPGVYKTPILTAREISMILMLTPRTALRRLELVFRDDGTDSQLIALIGTACPNLTFLELHRYAHDDNAFMRLDVNSVDIPFDSLAALLSPLRRLRVLRLNYDLGLHCTEGDNTPNRWSIWVPRSSFHLWQPFFERQAQVILAVLPWLETISFLTMSASIQHRWISWTDGEMEPIEPGDIWSIDHMWF